MNEKTEQLPINTRVRVNCKQNSGATGSTSSLPRTNATSKSVVATTSSSEVGISRLYAGCKNKSCQPAVHTCPCRSNRDTLAHFGFRRILTAAPDQTLFIAKRSALVVRFAVRFLTAPVVLKAETVAFRVESTRAITQGTIAWVRCVVTAPRAHTTCRRWSRGVG